MCNEHGSIPRIPKHDLEFFGAMQGLRSIATMMSLGHASPSGALPLNSRAFSESGVGFQYCAAFNSAMN